MPEISRFLGIVITMYFNDHEPPHFHVRYAEYRATFAIDALELLEGQLPPRVLGLVARMGSAPPVRVASQLDAAGNRG